MVKEPIELLMTDKWSCTSCVTAQVLYMFNKLKTPIKISDIDKRIGRKSNGYTVDGHFKELLRNGFHLTDIREFDMDKALGPNGYEYCRKFHKNNKELLAFYTPEKFAEWVKTAKAYREEKAKLPGKAIAEPKKPTANDVIRLLKNNPAVLMHLGSSTGANCHLVLAYEKVSSSIVKVYYPARSSPTLIEMSLSTIQNQLVQGESLIGIRQK